MSKASEQAYHKIRSKILEGSLAPGARLREEELAGVCGVSRTPVREALKRLEGEQLVSRSGSTHRPRVADWSIDEIEEGFILRVMLEGRAAERAATRIDEKMVEALSVSQQAALRDLDLTGSIDAFLEHNRAFHSRIVEASGSTRLASLLAGLIEPPVVTRTAIQYGAEQLRQSLAEHAQLLHAFRCRDPHWARAVMTVHIRRALHIYRTSFRA